MRSSIIAVALAILTQPICAGSSPLPDVREGETTHGTLMGTARDATTRAPVAGVAVELYNAMGSQIDTEWTDEDGIYRFTGLGPGTPPAATRSASKTEGPIGSWSALPGSWPSSTTASSASRVPATSPRASP